MLGFGNSEMGVAGAPGATPPAAGSDLFVLYNKSTDNSIADRSPFARPITMTGSISLDGSTPAWPGTKRMMWPTANNNWLSAPHDDRLYLTTPAWTIDVKFWLPNSAAGRTNILVNKRYNAWPNTGWSMHIDSNGFLVWEIGVNNEGMTSATAISYNTEMFASVVKKDGVLGLHLQGAPVGNKAYTAAITGDSCPLYIGVNGWQDGGSSPAGGNITGVRINDTVARYTPGAAYTPPTSF